MTKAGGKSSLVVDVAGISMKNPVMTASGTFVYGREFAPFLDLNSLGAIIVKGLSLKPSAGNPPPRTAETCGGMLNAIGLENVGLEAFIQEKLPFLRTLDTPLILNIYGREVEAYAELAERIEALDGVDGIEVNISCPNVKAGGIAFGTDPKMAFMVVQAVRRKTTLPVIAKLSPNVTDIAEIARSVEEAGADAVSLINTIRGMAVDLRRRRPKLATIVGGLSGPAIKPIALRMVWEVTRAVGIPVVGVGGITNADDALEFLMVGARAVQIGTANFVNPGVAEEIVNGLLRFLEENDIADINEFIGSLQ